MYKLIIILFFACIDYELHPLLSQDYIFKKPSRDGIGKFYKGREISKVMGHFGAAWLERKSRSAEENPMLAVELLNLKKNMILADFGEGTGYFTS